MLLLMSSLFLGEARLLPLARILHLLLLVFVR